MPSKGKKESARAVTGRRIPSTSATQFPDNTKRPFWSFKETTSPSDDFFDCYVAFKELGCHEYFWDWQGRKIDELLVKKLVGIYKTFFRSKPIGRDCFVTFRVEGNHPIEEMGRLYMSIISSNDFAASQGMFSPPLFEVLHSSGTPDNLLRFANLYNESVGMATEKLKHECGPKFLSMIPTHDFAAKNWYSLLNTYFGGYQSSFRCSMESFRPLVPRAALADKVGFVSAVLATKRVLSSYSSLSKITGVPVHPVVDAGPLLFRGGLDPAGVESFVDTYPGARTVTITPAFRYDYELDEVKGAVGRLNQLLPKNMAASYTREDAERMTRIEKIFARHFTQGIAAVQSLKGICEELGSVNRSLDGRLRTSFMLYSLGIPPELVGAGRAVVECIKEGLVGDLERFYPGIKHDLKRAGALLNKENLRFLAKTGKGWNLIQDDVNLIEDYTDGVLGPATTDSFLHRNHTSNVFHLWSTNKPFVKDLMAAARLRHCMG